VSYLLDTHVLLGWFATDRRLSEKQQRILDEATPKSSLLVSGISLWEVATLASLGRVRLDLPLRDWLERATAPPLVRVLPITPSIAAEVASLPDSFHRDPADRIIVSSARVHGATLLTRDDRIIKAELVETIG
jgi:PIN domain nuclease of toxin-antitoxin system